MSTIRVEIGLEHVAPGSSTHGRDRRYTEGPSRIFDDETPDGAAFLVALNAFLIEAWNHPAGPVSRSFPPGEPAVGDLTVWLTLRADILQPGETDSHREVAVAGDFVVTTREAFLADLAAFRDEEWPGMLVDAFPPNEPG